MSFKVDANSFPRLQMIGMVATVLLFTLVLGSYFLWAQQQQREQQLLTLEQEILSQQEALLESELQASISYVHYMRTQTESVLKREAKSQVDQAITLANSIYEQQKGKLSEDEIKQLIREALRDIRFFDGRGYLFIDDMDGLCILLPTAPHIEGKSLYDNQDDTGHYIMRGLIDAVKNPDESGYSRYRWYPPGNQQEMADKLAYVRLFEPFQWIIGTGDYLYRIENDLKQESLRRLSSFRFGQHGYIAVLDQQGDTLINTSLQILPDSSLVAELKQIAVDKILEIARQGGGVTEYQWFYPDGRGPVTKRAMIKVVPEWNWILVAGIYPDDLAPLLERHQIKLEGDWLDSLQTFLLVLCFSSVITLLLAIVFSRWLKTLFKRYQRDIDQQAGQLKANARELSLAAQVFESATEGIIITDPDNRIVAVNPAFTEITGYQEQETLGQNPSFMASGNHDEHFYQMMWRKLLEDGSWQGEVWNRRKDGVLFPEWLSLSVVRSDSGAVKNYIATLSDISLRKQNEERLRYLAEYDSLTDLPNRRLLADRATQAIHMARHNGQRLALLFVDLDRFKNVNDSLGHDIGDRLLCVIGERLQQAVRDGDSVSRVGGDEFVVLCPEVGLPEQVANIAHRITQVIAAPIELEGHSLACTPSVGIAFFPEDGDDFETLYRNADAALYHAKAQGRNQYQFFTQKMNQEVSQRLAMENALRLGIQQEELCLAYQPQYCIDSGRLRGVEALVRWHHPRQGLVPPNEFIPLAEESGLILPLGDWVMAEACRQGKEWLDQGFIEVEMAVNVSALQFRHGLVAQVEKVLQESGFPAHLLVIEVTESILMDDAEQAVDILRELKQLGVWISLDDFGTGYSSLSYLKSFPLDKLKIDQAFIRDLPMDADDIAITSSIIALARNLKLLTVAEGVESEQQLAFLNEQGCHIAQGYLLDRPLWPEDAAKRLHEATHKTEGGSANP